MLIAALPLTAVPQQRKQARSVKDISDDALLAPPELATDVLLTLFECGLVSNTATKRDLIEKACDLAPHARYKLDIGLIGTTNTDSDAGSLHAALRPGLSAAGIQARAITQMATMDKKSALRMFRDIPMPDAESASCAADRFTSRSSYFKALEVAATTFTAQEIENGDRTALLLQVVQNLRNPEDLALGLDILMRDMLLSDADFVQLMSAWSDTLAHAD